GVVVAFVPVGQDDGGVSLEVGVPESAEFEVIGGLWFIVVRGIGVPAVAKDQAETGASVPFFQIWLLRRRWPRRKHRSQYDAKCQPVHGASLSGHAQPGTKPGHRSRGMNAEFAKT